MGYGDFSRGLLYFCPMYNGPLCPEGQAKVPSLQSVSSLPWEMDSSPLCSFSDFICIPLDVFSFPSVQAGGRCGLRPRPLRSCVSPLILLLVGPVWTCFGSTILSVTQAIK